MASVLSPSFGSILGGPKLLPPPKDDAADRRDFNDPVATRKAIYDRTFAAAQNMPAVSNKRHTLRLLGVDWMDKDRWSLAEQKQAILAGKTLGRRLKGTWELVDNTTGQVLDSRQQTIARVPFLTDRGTFIHNGNEYTVINQLRLRPGIFTRAKESGEIESHANILPGRGFAHRYFLDPAKNIFYVKLQQAEIPLMPLLKSLGARDKDLQDAWGLEIWQANAQKDDPGALNKLYQRLVRTPVVDADGPTKSQAVADAIRSMEMDPDINQRTLGQPFKNLDLDAILATTKKLVAVSRGEADIDDRDNLAYQTVMGPEDLFSERLEKDYGGLRRRLLHQASFAGSLKGLHPGVLTRQLEAALLNSGLGNTPEEINMLELLDKRSRITRMGEGGLQSIDAIPDESRNVSTSHAGFMDPIRTPESLRAGVDIHLAGPVRKGTDGRVYSPFTDPRTGQVVWQSPQDLADQTIAFPGELNRKTKHVWGIKNGQLGRVRRNDVRLVMPRFENVFSPLGNLVPMKSATKAQRMAMGSRMYSQALPLAEPQSPWVQTGTPDNLDESFEERYGAHAGALKAERPGRVVSIDANGIKVRYDGGRQETLEIYETFPFNRKTYLYQTPVVKPGATFAAGDLLARSNYTDDKGVVALGRNARVAFLADKGWNFEDAVSISKSFAEKLASEHLYQHGLELADDYKTGKRDYVSLFPSRYNRQVLDKLDEHGVVKVGQVVEKGDPLVLAARRRDTAQNKVHKRRAQMYSDACDTWKHDNPGVVTDVHRDNKGVTVLVKSYSPMQVGDKLAGRHGNKGVVARIIDDHDMPHGADGQPFEILLNPLGVITRQNDSQVFEAVLGKIAAKTGQPYKVQDFESIQDLAEYTMAEAKKHGVSDLEDVIDPETERKIRGVLAGNMFFMKLAHQSEGKGQSRSTGGYTASGEPAKGSDHASKRVSLMDNNALLAHSAYETIRDASAIRGQKNEAWWLAFLQGVRPPDPKVPDVYEKFVEELRGSGINVVPQGSQLHIMALTDQDVQRQAGGREIKSGETVKFEKGLEPISGGLFDPQLTGGHHGNRWAQVTLAEPLPNPVMAEPIRRILGLTEKELEAVIAGKRELGSGTGPEAISRALANVNVDRELALAREQIKSGRKTHRDAAVRKLGYLKSCQRLGIHPRDWVLKAVPVLPPKFRPVSVISDKKLPLVADANYLYKELIDANDNLKEMGGLVDDVGEERLALYHAFKAVTGLGSPVHPKLQEKRVSGLLSHIFGSSPKFGTVQRRLLSNTVDLVGRAVITPNPDLDMDHVALPEDKAWEIYKPFIVRRLRRRGMPFTQAAQAVEQRSSLAKGEMLKEMEERPVIINRAPVLHKFGMLAFYPRLTTSHTMEISPLVVKGFGADFDGDQMNYHVPASDEAKEEAVERLLPSRNLISPADFKTPVHSPSQEYVGGLFAASRASGRRPRVFRSTADVLAAYRRGEIDINDPVEVLS